MIGRPIRRLLNFDVDNTALVLPDTLSHEDWIVVGVELLRMEGGVMWWLGDWLCYGQARKWGEKYDEAVALGFNYQTARDAAWVAGEFQLSRRHDKLSWSHHREVAVLEPADADHLLNDAERNGWSRVELRIRVKQFKQGSYTRISGPDGSICGFDELHRLVAEGYRFGNIYVDPPWLYDNQRTRGATCDHYEGLTVDQLRDPQLLPVAALAADAAHLHLWTTNAFLFECPRIFEAWGFEFRSSFVWVKSELGIGNYWRNGHEFLLTAVRGDARHFDDRNLRSWLECSRGRHSDKPDQVRDMIARASPTPRLELFARSEHEGWLSWGNQITKNLFSKQINVQAFAPPPLLS
jgi:N6-adenosine-specific RNA methylase IME4